MRLVFISSTFKDMQSERDQLHNKVLPLIDEKLLEFGESLHFGDLRWGVNTSGYSEEESSKKVISLCLDRIDDCKPYMIVFIGERYGWMPEKTLVEEVCLQKNIQMKDYDFSVTELEIEYGALLHPDYEGRILFYFREELDTSKMTDEEKKIYLAESDLHKEKITKLKQKIKKLYPNYIRNYRVYFDEEKRILTGFDEINKQVYNDLLKIFKLDIEKENEITPEDKFYRNSENYLRNYYKDKIEIGDISKVDKNNGLFDSLDGTTYSYNNNPILKIIHGEYGKGVRTQIALNYLDSLNYKNVLSIPMVLSGESIDDIIHLICYKIENILSFDHKKTNNLNYLLELFNKIEDSKKYISFFITSSNTRFISLLLKVEAIQNLNRKYFKYIQFNFGYSGLLDHKMHIPYYFFSRVCKLGSIKNSNIARRMLLSMVEKKKKELSNNVISKILSKKDSKEPLYLSLVVDRLCMFDEFDFKQIRKLGDDMSAIEEYMLQIVDNYADNLEDIIYELFNELCERINNHTVVYFISLLSYDMVFNIHAIEEFCKYLCLPYEESDFILFSKLYPSLIEKVKEGTYQFSNQLIKNVAKRFKIERLPNLDNEIIKYIETLDEKSNMYIKAYPYYLVNSKNTDKIIDSLIKISHIFDSLLVNDLYNHSSYLLYNNFKNEISDILNNDSEYYYEFIIDLLDKLSDSLVFNEHISLTDLVVTPLINSLEKNDEINARNLCIKIMDYIFDHKEYLKNKEYLKVVTPLIIYIAIVRMDLSLFGEKYNDNKEIIRMIIVNSSNILDGKDLIKSQSVYTESINLFYNSIKNRRFRDGLDNSIYTLFIPTISKVLLELDKMHHNENYAYFNLLTQRSFMNFLQNNKEEAYNDALTAFEMIKDYTFNNNDALLKDIFTPLYYLIQIITYMNIKYNKVDLLVGYIYDILKMVNISLANCSNYNRNIENLICLYQEIFNKVIINYPQRFEKDVLINYILFFIKALKPIIIKDNMKIEVLYDILNELPNDFINYNEVYQYYLELSNNSYISLEDKKLLEKVIDKFYK